MPAASKLGHPVYVLQKATMLRCIRNQRSRIFYSMMSLKMLASMPNVKTIKDHAYS